MKQFICLLFCSFFTFEIAFAQIDWVRQTREFYNGTNYEGTASVNSIATDGLDNVYVTGRYNGLTTFDTASIADEFGPVYLAKYQSDGDIEWVRPVEGNSANESKAVAVNANGEVFITGVYRHTNSNTILNFGNVMLEGNRRESAFIAKCDTDGNFIWANRILAEDSPGSFVDPVDMVAAGNGDLIVLGNVENPVSIDGQTFNPTNEREAMFLARFDGDGNLVWFKHNENGGQFTNIEGARLEMGSVGQLYVNGSYSGDPVWGTDTLTAPESADHFLARFDGNGDLAWVRSQLSRGVDQVPAQFGVDADDNVYFALRAGGGDLRFDDLTISGTNFTGRFIFLKYNAQGDREFIKSFVGTSIGGGIEDGTVLVHAAADGTVFLSGEFFNGSDGNYITFGGQDSFLMPNIFTDEPAHFLLSLNAEGEYRDVAFVIDEYLTPPNTTSEFEVVAMTLNTAGKLLLTGEFDGIYKVGTDTLNTPAQDQLFVMQLDPDVLFEVSTGIEKRLLQTQVRIFPNPARHWVRVDMAPSLQHQSVSYRLMTMEGKEIKRGTGTNTIQLSGLPPGIYTLMMEIEGKWIGKKLMIEQ